MLCKIVYFDEDSVTDFVQIVAGGQLEKTTELLNQSQENGKTELGAKVGIGLSGVFRALMGFEGSASVGASIGASFNSNEMAKNIVKNTNVESSDDIRKRVNIARNIQRDRYKYDGIYSNSELTPKLIRKYYNLSHNAENILKVAYQKLGLSARGYSKILKVARTIADIEGEEQIKEEHIAEAIQYRNLDKKYWNSGRYEK